MKIGIDCRFWNETGIGRYTRNLVTSLAALDKKNEYVLFVRSIDYKKIRDLVKNENFRLKLADVSWHSIEEQLRFPGVLNSSKLDLMHFPYFSIPIMYRKPYIVTVHDLIVNRFNTGKASTLPLPIYRAKRVAYHAVIKNAVDKSKAIIVPSDTVKKDVLAEYKRVRPAKVSVIYEGGFDKKTASKAPSDPLVEGRYILRVGNFYPHKNIGRLLLAFKDFVYEGYDNHDVKLVIVGKKDFFYSKVAKRIAALNIEDNIVFLENPSDEELLNLYRNAQVTIVPSLSEGFSLTAVEAMSCSCPVIVSDIPIHREICGEVGIYCNPYDTRDINQKINFVLSLSDKKRKTIVDKGVKVSEKYSWEKMAKETLSLYESIR